MLKNTYFLKYYEKTQSIMKNIAKIFKNKIKSFYQSGFDSIKTKKLQLSINLDKNFNHSNEIKEKCSSLLKKDRSKSLIRLK
jgi:methionine synthase II (cobalamin-independent)